jgi:hypothetical protein
MFSVVSRLSELLCMGQKGVVRFALMAGHSDRVNDSLDTCVNLWMRPFGDHHEPFSQESTSGGATSNHFPKY